jgi:hypothetical protein
MIARLLLIARAATRTRAATGLHFPVPFLFSRENLHWRFPSFATWLESQSLLKSKHM